MITNDPQQNADMADNIFASNVTPATPTGAAPLHPNDNIFFNMGTGDRTIAPPPMTDSGQTHYAAVNASQDKAALALKDYQSKTSASTYAGNLINPLTYAKGLFGLAQSIGDHPADTASAAASGLLNGVTLGNGEAFANGVTTIAKNLGVEDKTAQSMGSFFNSKNDNNDTLYGVRSGFDFAGQAAPYMVGDELLASGLKYAQAPFIAKYGKLANFLRAKVLPGAIAFNAIGQTEEALKGASVQERLQRAGLDTALSVAAPIAGEVFGSLKNTIFKTDISKIEPWYWNKGYGKVPVETPAATATGEAAGAGGAAVSDISKTGQQPLDLSNGPVKPGESMGPEVRDITRPRIAVEVPASAFNPNAAEGKTATVVTNDLDALKNYIKGSSDITYKQVESLGKDINGDPILARHSFDPETGLHTIYTTDATTASSLAHEMGHYFDAKLMDNVNRFSALLPGAIKNPSTLEDTLTSYAVKLLGGEATGKEISAKIVSLVDSMQEEINALSRARRGGVAASKGSERFADAVSQILVKGGAKDAPALAGFLEHAQATKDAMALFGRKISSAVEAVGERNAIPKKLSSLVEEAGKVKNVDEFINSRETYYRGGKSGNWISPDESFAAQYGKVTEYKVPKNLNLLDATTSKADELASKFLGKNVEDSLATTDLWYEPSKEFSNFLKKEGYDGFENDKNIFLVDKNNLQTEQELKDVFKTVSDASKKTSLVTGEESKVLDRIPTGRQPATIPINAGNITKDVDAEVFINTKILPLVTGAERIAKTDEEIIQRALSSKLTEDGFNKILTERFGNLSEDLMKAKQFMLDGATSLAERLGGRSMSEITGQEAKDLIGEYNRIVQTYEVFAGVRTELSNSFRTLGLAANPGENDTMIQALEAIQKSIGDEKDPFKIAQKLMNAQKNDIVEKYFKIWYPAVLSGPKTQIRNMIGNMAGITMDSLSSLFTSQGRSEFGARMLGMINAQKDAINFAVKVFKGEETVYSKFYEAAAPEIRSFKGLNAFQSYVGGSLEGMDAYFSKVYQDGEIAAMRVGGDTFGLANKELAGSLETAMGSVKGQMATFRNPLENTFVGGTAKLLQSAKRADSKVLRALTTFFVPFVRTIANITERQLDFLPILNIARTFDFDIPLMGKSGAKQLFENRAERVLAQAGFKEGIALEAKNAGLDAIATKGYIADETARVKGILVDRFRTQQLGKFYTGLAVSAATLPLALTGRITGNGPSDANQKALLMQTGWRPNSLILPDGTAIPYNNMLLPFAAILSVAGNLNDAIRYSPENSSVLKNIEDGFVGFMKSEIDQSFLSGIVDVVDAISGNKTFGQWAANFAANAIPIPAAYTQMKDIIFPERYDASSFNEIVRQKMGITGEVFGMPALAPKVDALGNPVKADLIYGTLPPIGNEDMNGDPVYQFMADNDTFVSKPSKSLVVKGPQGASRQITKEEYSQFVQDSGQEIYAKLKSRVESGYFDQFKTKDQIKQAINAIVQPIRTKYKNKIKY